MIHLQKYKKFCNVQARKFYFLLSSISQNIRKAFFLRKHKKLFNLRTRKFHFLKYKNIFRVGLFFFELGLKSDLGSCILYYYPIFKKMSTICNYEKLINTYLKQNSQLFSCIPIICWQCALFSFFSLNIAQTHCFSRFL